MLLSIQLVICQVMYMLKPDDDWEDFRLCGRASVPQMVDRITGELQFEKWPRPWTTRRPLLDFPILRGINKVCHYLLNCVTRDCRLLCIDRDGGTLVVV